MRFAVAVVYEIEAPTREDAEDHSSLRAHFADSDGIEAMFGSRAVEIPAGFEHGEHYGYDNTVPNVYPYDERAVGAPTLVSFVLTEQERRVVGRALEVTELVGDVIAESLHEEPMHKPTLHALRDKIGVVA